MTSSSLKRPLSTLCTQWDANLKIALAKQVSTREEILTTWTLSSMITMETVEPCKSKYRPLLPLLEAKVTNLPFQDAKSWVRLLTIESSRESKSTSTLPMLSSNQTRLKFQFQLSSSWMASIKERSTKNI